MDGGQPGAVSARIWRIPVRSPRPTGHEYLAHRPSELVLSCVSQRNDALRLTWWTSRFCHSNGVAVSL